MLSMLAAMGPQRPLADKALARAGVWNVVSEGWYRLDAALAGVQAIAEAGPNAVFSFGKSVPKHAHLPPHIDSIAASLTLLDTAYHMNHRRDGRCMFDQVTGEMLEGIGHYRCHIDGKRRIVMVCDTPYPPDFDRGTVAGFARRFEPHAEVELDATKPTRLRGGESCTFIVTW